MPISHGIVGNPACLEPGMNGRKEGNKMTENGARQVEYKILRNRHQFFCVCVSLIFSTEPGRQRLLVNIC